MLARTLSIAVALSIAAALLLAGCNTTTDDARPADQVDAAERDGWRVGFTEGRRYRVSWRSHPEPIVAGEPFELEVAVARGSSQPLIGTAARINVEARPTDGGAGPRRNGEIRPIGAGAFRVTGMTLPAGAWLLTIDVYVGAESGRATFELQL